MSQTNASILQALTVLNSSFNAGVLKNF